MTTPDSTPSAGVERPPAIRLRPYADGDLWIQRRFLADPDATRWLGGTETDEQIVRRHGRYVAMTDPREGSMCTIELADGRPEEAARLVGALDGVREAILEGRLLRARVEHGPRAVPAIVSALESGGVPVASVTTARPSLDDVYLHYTGRDFHAEDEAGGATA